MFDRFGEGTTPRSVINAAASSAGVTSKAGLRTLIPSGAQRTPRFVRNVAVCGNTIGTDRNGLNVA